MASRGPEHPVRDIVIAVLISLVVGFVYLTGKPFWLQDSSQPQGSSSPPNQSGSATSSSSQPPPSPSPSAAPGVIGFQGGCAPFVVYAQNRWPAYGAAIRTAPSQTAKKIEGRAANEVIAVNGWVHSEVAYSWDPPPFNNDVWFHLADGSGWVSFAGVRGTVTQPDTTLHDPDGGPPAPMDAGCEGTAQ